MAGVSRDDSMADLYNGRIVALASEAGIPSPLDDSQVPKGVKVCAASLDNPLCGDEIEVSLWVREGRVIDVGFKVRGCLLTEAAAVAMKNLCAGNEIFGLDRVVASVKDFLEEGGDLHPDWASSLDCFAPVRQHPGRRGCVLLPFQAMLSALEKS